MKKSILLLASAALLFAGCAKVVNDEPEVVPEPEQTTQKVTLKASMGENTRVSADAAGYYAWQQGDVIGVLTTDGFRMSDPAQNSGTTVDFSVTLDQGEKLGDYAFYPVTPMTEGRFGDAEFSLSSEYLYVKDATNMPMMGAITSNGVSFRAVGGLIKLIVYNVPAGTDVLEFTVNDEDAKINGAFEVIKEVGDDNEEHDVIKLNTNEGSGNNKLYFYLWEEDENYNFVRSLWEQNMVFYIPLPCGTYHSFTFSFNDIRDDSGTPLSQTTSVTKSATMGGDGLQVHRNEIIVPPALNVAPPITTATLWSEDFSGFSANEVPGEDGNGVGYDNATVSYSVYNNGSTTKVYNEKLAGGTAPELLVSKAHGTFTASGIPSAGATSATLSFLANKTSIKVTSTTTGVTLSKVSGSSYSYNLTIESSVTSFDLVFETTGSDNVRLDNIVLEATIGSAPVTPYISTQSESATIAMGRLEASIDAVKINNPLDGTGIVATTDVDWLDLVFEGSNGFEVGKKLKATAKSYWYGAEPRTATVTLKATGATKTVTIKQNASFVPLPTLTPTPGNATFTIVWSGDSRAKSYVGYYSSSELDNPSTGTELTITNDGTTYSGTPSGTVVNGTTYHVYVKVNEVADDDAAVYHASSEWSHTTVKPTEPVTDYALINTSNVSLSKSGTEVTNAKVIIESVEYAALKAGTGSTAGVINNLTIPEGSTHLHFHAAGWNTESVTIKITCGTTTIATKELTSDSGIKSNTPFTLSGSPADYYFDIPLTGMTTDKTFVFTVTSGKRFVLWGVNTTSN